MIDNLRQILSGGEIQNQNVRQERGALQINIEE